MKTEMTSALVAIEESSLEAVAGGSYPAPVDIKVLDLDLNFNYQNNSIDFSHNDIQAVGPAVFQFTQQNVNGAA